MLKWLIVCVLPGVDEVLASFLRLVNMLIKDDLPTLDLPINATSMRSGLGQSESFRQLLTYVAFLIFILSALLMDTKLTATDNLLYLSGSI